jgi:urease accessory protein
VSLDLAEPTDTSTPVAGTARLRFSRCGERTVLDRSFATSPVKVFTTRAAGATCWVCAATLGGGFVSGDAIRMRVEAGSHARAVLATQASTKVYRSLRPTSQHITATLDDEALLAVVPDPIVCFAGAHFSQEQRYDLSGSANLVVIDWMTSGRHAVGERWAFRHYASRIDVRRAGRRLLYDAVLLNESDGAIAERMGRFEVCVTAVITGRLLTAESARIVHDAAALGVQKHSTLVVAAWPLADGGALLRMSGMSVEQVGAALRERLTFLPDLLGDDPWSRKW